MLNHLADYARSQGVGTLRLETGIHQHAAIALYEQTGFERIQPFGEYRDDPLSSFTKNAISEFCGSERHCLGSEPCLEVITPKPLWSPLCEGDVSRLRELSLEL
jgi:hypothetical protein